MQMCPRCGKVYDESEYSRCPYCHPYHDSGRVQTVMLYGRDEKQTKYVSAPKLKKHTRKD